jgi:cysteine-rich repeat protein
VSTTSIPRQRSAHGPALLAIALLSLCACGDDDSAAGDQDGGRDSGESGGADDGGPDVDVDGGGGRRDAGADSGIPSDGGDAGPDGGDAGPDGGDAATEACGNGTLDDGEACDDGDADAGDGCTACAVEAGWNCSGVPSLCVARLDADLLLAGNQLAALGTLDPAAVEAPVALAGLNAGDTLVAIDRRSTNGMLYGLGHNSVAGTVRLYSVSSVTGQCTALGTPAAFTANDGTTPAPVTGTQFDIDFNPAVDRLRVVNNAGQNFRMNPNNGAPLDSNPGVVGIQMDGAINGPTTTLHGTAHTNNSLNQAATTQYALDQNSDTLYIQNPANGGLQTVPVSLSTPVDLVRGFDIPAGVDVATSNAGASGSGFAVVRLAGESMDSLVRVDLVTGALSGATPIGTSVIGLALQNIAALPMMALSADGSQIVRFSSATPGSATTGPITGVTAGETLIGIDYRPQTGQLLGLGIDATANTGTLYVVDPAGGCSAIGAPSQVAFVSLDLPPASAGYGFDVNPTVDRVRVVTGTGLNFRVNPDSGAGILDVAVTGLSAGSTGLSGAAYTNSYGMSLVGGVTTLYVLDATANGLHVLNPPNAGVATQFLAITSGGAALDFDPVSGFDFAGDVRVSEASAAAAGIAHAAFTVAGVAKLFTLDLATGAATERGTIGAGTPLGALAVGHANVR